MEFESWEEMYNTIIEGTDLYSESERLYVFVYNDANALCYYNIDTDEAAELSEKSSVGGDYWGAFLGIGGRILDDMDYDNYRYSNNEEERNLYLKPSIDFCKEYFNVDDWVDTREYIK